MKKLIYGLFAFFLIIFGGIFSFCSPLQANDTPRVLVEDEYVIVLFLYVPQVRNNSTSQGTRRFEMQRIEGKMYIDWNSDDTYTISFASLVNKRFKIGEKNVTYEGIVDDEMLYPSFTYLGSNLSEKFTTPALSFYCSLMPSYAIGEMTEDNSFYLYLSGKGTSVSTGDGRIARRFTGYVAGRQGCSCYDYGHKSPTRAAGISGPTDRVVDIAATYGRWTARFKQRIYAY